jgi:pimeloyl-ACP methyl ester carboxylesterase/3-hydroxyisobutyrate dehydrogenase-like beta-hydroxyacid dehydrogenase
MGISLAVCARNSGCTAYWASEGRSSQTRGRSEEHQLTDAGTLERMCRVCEILISVCPPHAADEVASAVAACGFAGVLADVNAISPMRSRQLRDVIAAGGGRFVDGGVVGGPAWKDGTTTLYLSGPEATAVADCFSAGPVRTIVLGDEIGRASALKMCYAANSKGGFALISAVMAAADSLGVRAELEAQWSRDDPVFVATTQDRMRSVTRKAWRFAGEMKEIAATFESAGLPGGFHAAAHDVYERLEGFKGAEPLPGLDEVIRSLRLDPRTGQKPGVIENFTVESGRAALAANRHGDGRPVIFLHAGVADSRMWTGQMPAVGSRACAVSYDRRGFGRTSTPDEPFSNTDDLRAVHESVSDQPVVLVGCSQGGRISIDYALAYPGQVAGLVLIAPAVSGAPGWTDLPAGIEELSDELDRAGERGDLDRVNEIEARFWLDGPLGAGGRVTGGLRDLFLDMNAIALRHPELTGEQEPRPAYERVSRIEVPVLVMWGDLDFPDTVKNCRHLADTMPDARGFEIPGVAHLPNLERPDTVNEFIVDFVDRRLA